MDAEWDVGVVKYIIEIPDEEKEKMESQKRYLDNGGDIWLNSWGDDPDVVTVLFIEEIP